jgi:hypothetical protein
MRDLNPGPLDTGDWRREFIGQWQLAFSLDSVRAEGETEVVPMHRANGNVVVGSLVITDSVVRSPWILGLRSSLTIDFVPLLGRPMSCFDPPPTAVRLERADDGLVFDFTPGASDCGFTADVQLRNHSLTGTWTEGAFAGTPAKGRITMRRLH